jgi:hypothetical protein
MKKLTFLTTMAIAALLFTSCSKIDYKSFCGTWGVEKIEYYNTDYAGNPIPASMETYTYDPNDVNNSIRLTFNEDKTGEMRDSAIDSIGVDYDEATGAYDHYIICPDTVLVTPFTYSYDQTDRTLYMNMKYEDRLRTFKLQISNFTDDSFVYENEYDMDYAEKAYLKRITKSSSKSATRQTPSHPHKYGSFLGGK